MKDKKHSGQATLEAAFVLPAVLMVILLLLQPSIVLFDRLVINAAAMETLRLADVQPTSATQPVCAEDLCSRRLSVIPNASLFHVGGAEGWKIESRTGQNGTDIEIAHDIRLLPLIGDAYGALSGSSEGIYRQSVTVQGSCRPEWVSGVYQDWQGIWD